MKQTPIAVAVAAVLGATTANAVSVPVNLVSHLSLSSGGESAADLSTSTATSTALVMASALWAAPTARTRDGGRDPGWPARRLTRTPRRLQWG